jgi:hypothetical protein
VLENDRARLLGERHDFRQQLAVVHVHSTGAKARST